MKTPTSLHGEAAKRLGVSTCRCSLEVNIGSTRLSKHADVVLRGKAGEILPKLLQLVRESPKHEVRRPKAVKQVALKKGCGTAAERPETHEHDEFSMVFSWF